MGDALGILSKSMDIENLDKTKVMGLVETRVEHYKDNSLWSSLSIEEENMLREAAVKARLIPEAYQKARFDTVMLRNRINEEMRSRPKSSRYTIKNYNAYAELCNGILSALGANQKITQSYIIGAPNGFGKTSFANDAILRMFARGQNVAPYVSLSELAEIKLANDARLAKGLTFSVRGIKSREQDELERFVGDGYEWDIEKIYETHGHPTVCNKVPVSVIGRYSWSEYMNADVLITYFTTIESKVLESKILQHILYLRATKGLPTIAMISTSLAPYLNDPMLAEMVWDEIYDSSKSDKPCYDRVKHVSCYKNIKKLYMNTDDPNDYVD